MLNLEHIWIRWCSKWLTWWVTKKWTRNLFWGAVVFPAGQNARSCLWLRPLIIPVMKRKRCGNLRFCEKVHQMNGTDIQTHLHSFIQMVGVLDDSPLSGAHLHVPQFCPHDEWTGWGPSMLYKCHPIWLSSLSLTEVMYFPDLDRRLFGMDLIILRVL